MARLLKAPRKHTVFHVMREKFSLVSVMPELPKDDEVFKLISDGGFSSIAFIRYLADECGINEMYASSLAIGKKHLESLDVMKQQGHLDKATFVVGDIMQQGNANKKYKYFDFFKDVCHKNGWQFYVRRNHSKIILFATASGRFVLETSSNLNENPSVEQFSFEKNTDLYHFYKNDFFSLFEKEG